MEALSSESTLDEILDGVLRYEWLPVEERDFRVRYDSAFVNEVSIESPVFYSIPSPQLHVRADDTSQIAGVPTRQS